LLEPGTYHDWIAAAGGYRTLGSLSRWVLRVGAEQSRYVHLHPGRWAPLTCRVRANVLKTSVMAVAYARTHGCEPADITLVNHVRGTFLDLPPVAGTLRDDQGLGAMIALLARSSLEAAFPDKPDA